MEKVILGIVGPKSSGKDTVADYLCKKYGFVNFSTGDMIRQYIKENNLGEPERDLLIRTGNELRKKYGPDYLARKALDNDSDRIIVSGIRAIAEAKAVLDNGGELISVNAPIELRYKRIFSRNRIGDNISFEKFKAQEKAEENSNDPAAQNISGVMKLARYQIENSGTLKELYKKVDSLIKKIGIE